MIRLNQRGDNYLEGPRGEVNGPRGRKVTCVFCLLDQHGASADKVVKHQHKMSIEFATEGKQSELNWLSDRIMGLVQLSVMSGLRTLRVPQVPIHFIFTLTSLKHCIIKITTHLRMANIIVICLINHESNLLHNEFVNLSG